MPYGAIDPARLNGDALTRWYLRSPADIEQERQAAAAQRYASFFGDQSGSSMPQDGIALEELRPSLGGDQFDRSALTPGSDYGLPPEDHIPSAGMSQTQVISDPMMFAPAPSDSLQDTDGLQLASGPTKDQCIKQCSPLLERLQPPGSDRNQWDFHKCVNSCMDQNHRSSPNSLPTGRTPPVPTPTPAPWWMWISRLLPEVAPVLA